MALNLSGLSNAANVARSLANLILVTPSQTVGYQAQNAPSWQKNTAALPPTLVFNYEGEQTAQLSSDITDHYIEDNSAIQDMIALKPEIITTQGFVGELNDIAPAALQILKTAAEKLTTISAYVPALSTTALLAYANAFALYQTGQALVDSGVSIWATINGTNGANVINGSGQTTQNPNQTKQQIYFQQFYGYWRKRTLFTIQTPWAIFQDMAIQSVRAIQNAETRVISDFEVTFKLLRFASTQVSVATLYDVNGMQGRAFNQASDVVNLGTKALTPSSTSFGSLLA